MNSYTRASFSHNTLLQTRAVQMTLSHKQSLWLAAIHFFLWLSHNCFL